MAILTFKQIIIYLISAGMILSTGTLYQNIYGKDLFPIITILLMSLLVFYESIIKVKKLKITFSSLLGLLFISMVPFIIDFINFIPSFQITFFHILVITLSFLIGKSIREKIFKAYFNLLVTLAIISMIYFFANIFYDIDRILLNSE